MDRNDLTRIEKRVTELVDQMLSSILEPHLKLRLKENLMVEIKPVLNFEKTGGLTLLADLQKMLETWSERLEPQQINFLAEKVTAVVAETFAQKVDPNLSISDLY